ncbi:hypothetical protein EJB05_39787, partial [Eragrostis curvula]
MVTSSNLLNVLYFYLFLLALTAPAAKAASSDILSRGRNVTDGDTLVSAGGSFTLGFFSPGASTKRYLGIWFSVSEDVVYWVANRDRPLDDTSGALAITDAGSLLLLDGSGQVAWSSNTTGATAPATARLLDSGNLVVVGDPSSGAILWQSFDHPSNTLLPGMKIGRNLWTGAGWSLSSWRSAGDPSPGRYRYTTDASGAAPENVLWDGEAERYRTGPWNELRFSGVPEMTTYADMFAYELTLRVSSYANMSAYVVISGTPLNRSSFQGPGVVQRLVWDAGTRAWRTFFQGPRDVCDAYEWRMREASGGCRRNATLHCAGAGNGTTTTDGFLLFRGVKLPDTRNASVDEAVALEECATRCLANCSCVAYAPAVIRGGGAGSSCIIWTSGLVDLRYVDGGQDLYLRSANKSELASFVMVLPHVVALRRRPVAGGQPPRAGHQRAGYPTSSRGKGTPRRSARARGTAGGLFSGVPEASTYTYLVTYQVTTSPGKIRYGYTAKAGAPLTRVVVMDTGVVRRLVWDASARAWKTFFRGPRDVCDAYSKCGAFSVCDAGPARRTRRSAAASRGSAFSPASPWEWKTKKTSGGCRRNVALDCGATDGFVVATRSNHPDDLLSEQRRCIQNGLLCVQLSPGDRPPCVLFSPC